MKTITFKIWYSFNNNDDYIYIDAVDKTEALKKFKERSNNNYVVWSITEDDEY